LDVHSFPTRRSSDLKGYVAASMRDLAESMGVEASSLYNHIGSKQELLQSICFKVALKFNNELTAITSAKGNVVPRLEALIRFHIHMMLENFDEVYVANHEWKQLKEPYLSHFLIQRRAYEKRFIALVETGIRTHELKAVNHQVAVLTILSAVRGLEFWQNKKKISHQILEDDMTNHLLKGILN
jgi:AcrR family transcriptional regulator